MARACSCSNSSCCRRSAASRMCWGGRGRHTGQVSPAPCREPRPGFPHSQPAPRSDSPPASRLLPRGAGSAGEILTPTSLPPLFARFLFYVPRAREQSCRFLCGGESLFSLFDKILSFSAPAATPRSSANTSQDAWLFPICRMGPVTLPHSYGYCG